MRIACLAVFALLAGCAGSSGKGDWPSLAPRAGERVAVVQTPGACSGCGLATTVVAPPVPVRAEEPVRTLPADAAVTLAAVERELRGIEAKLPKQAAETRRAVAAARGKAEGDDASVSAEVQRTRLEALVLPLPDLQERLDTLSAAAEGVSGAEAVSARIAALLARIGAAAAMADLR